MPHMIFDEGNEKNKSCVKGDFNLQKERFWKGGEDEIKRFFRGNRFKKLFEIGHDFLNEEITEEKKDDQEKNQKSPNDEK